MSVISTRTVRAGGYAVAYTEAGPPDGAVIVLLHGLASSGETWDKALPYLAGHGLRVIALDLIGHGRSDKPRRSYLLDDFADSLRDVLDALDIGRAALCGHSLGGAIAMHTRHRHPERVAALVLVSAGGLGREVHPLLRAASLPVAPALLGLATRPTLRRLYRQPRLHRALRLTDDNLVNLRRAGRALGTPAGRSAFFASLRGVIEAKGQRGSFIAMDQLARDVPTLLVWNRGDPVIPVAHAQAAHEHLPGSRLLILEGSSHEPHRGEAARFADEVAAFLRPTM